MRKLLPIVAAVILALLAVGLCARVARDALGAPADEAADVLPIYLAMVTLAEGGDPGSRQHLEASYEARGLRARAATYSTLYPATLPALLRPAAGLGWPGFVKLWRVTLLLALLGCGLLGAALLPRHGWARGLAAPLAVVLLLLLPASAECIRLGQINMVLALLMVLAMFCVARRWDGAAGSALAFGAAAKLVPGLLVLPLLVARRWRAAGAAALVGALCLGVTMAWLPLERILDGVVQTARFQAAIHPDWAARHMRPAGWLAFLATLRHGPLLLLTLALGLPAAALKPRRSVLLAVLAMLSAWLGCTASAFHMLYLPLLYPALVYVVLWPLVRESDWRWALPSSALALAALALGFGVRPESVVLEARMSLVGFVLWGLCLVRLVDAWRRGSRAPGHPLLERVLAVYPAAVALLVGVLFARALPAHRPLAPPVPPVMQEEIRVGFIRPGDPAPGSTETASTEAPSSVDHRRTGQWPQVVVGSTVMPGSHGALQRHLELSAETWAALEGEPELGGWARWVLDATPTNELREQLAADTLRCLVREGLALEAVADDPRLDALRASYQGALTGAAAPERSRRSLGD